jgi:integrase
MNCLSAILHTAKNEWLWINDVPTQRVKKPQDPPPRDRLISQYEIDSLCQSLGYDGISVPETKSQFIAVAFLFAIETAMREGEICAIKPHWISGNVVHLPAENSKNGTKRDIPLSKRAVELLGLLPQDTLFGLTAANLSALFRKQKLISGVEGVNFHDTRHLAITRLSKKLDVLALARLTGHKDIKQLLRYYNETASEIAKRLD